MNTNFIFITLGQTELGLIKVTILHKVLVGNDFHSINRKLYTKNLTLEEIIKDLITKNEFKANNKKIPFNFKSSA